MSRADPSLAVLGAINVDLVVSGAALPGPGETVTGGSFSRHQGGKGGNQAVAAARAARPDTDVTMLGCVGDDDLGRGAVEALRAEGIDVDGVQTASGAPTGVALITVGPGGENQIAVAPGANVAIDPARLRRDLVQTQPDLILLSLEVSEQAARAAIEWCESRDVRVLMNPAPVQSWAADLFERATYLTPNEHELVAIGGLPEGVRVVETRGGDGAVIHGVGSQVIAAPAVDVVDTTGAGDCFNGVLAVALAEGAALGEAVTRAVRAAALSVRVGGAREGMPTRAVIDGPPVA